MKSVNNKYLIENEINDEENFTDYLVVKNDDKKKYVLSILKNTFTYEQIHEYILNNFKSIKSFNFDNIVNLISAEVIWNIDGIMLDKPQYGYITEYVKDSINVKEYLNNCTSSEKFDIFMRICAIVNTLNMSGYLFDEVTLKDIVLKKQENGRLIIKIKSLLHNEIRKFRLSNNSYNSSVYLYNDKLEEENYVNDNVEQIIILFQEMFSYKELRNELNDIRDIGRIYIQSSAINRYLKIKSLIKYVNEKRNTSYPMFIKEALDTINMDIDIINSDEEIKIVENAYKSIAGNKEKYKIIAFNGEYGTGKTRLLEELKYKLENKYLKNVIYIKSYDNDISKKDIYDMYLKDIYRCADMELFNKYELYIKKLISLSLDKETKIDEIQIMQLINRVGKFICEHTRSNYLNIIIDDFDKRSKTFKKLIKYLAFVENNLENILIVFSMNKSSADESFKRYLKDLNDLNQYEEYKINYFNKYNTSKMLKNILRTTDNLSELSNKIYSETLGNPQYIKSAVEDLYKRKILYFNNNTGKWDTNIKVNEILLPKTLEKNLEVNLLSLSEDEISVLKKLSIYETPLSERIILQDLLNRESEIEIYKNLKSKRYLIDKISDSGILIGFDNDLLRNVLYIKLTEYEKIKIHEKACEILEGTLESSDYYAEEFIYHLEKSNNIDKFIFYAIKYAQKQDEIGEVLKSITYYKKALKYCRDKQAVEVAISIAENYEKISNHEKSYDYLEMAQDTVCKDKDYKMQICIKLKIIIIKMKRNSEIDSFIENELNDIKIKLREMNCPLAEAYYYYAISIKYRFEYNHESILFNAQKAMDICEENKIFEDIYGWVTITSAIAHISYENYDIAKKLCTKAIGVFEKNNNKKGKYFSQLINVNIYQEEGKDLSIVLDKYFEINRLCNKYKLYKKEILSLIYISNAYYENENFIETEKYLLKALARQREERIDTYSVTICNYLCTLYIRLGQIKQVIKYYHLTKEMQKGVRLTENEVINFNTTSALYNSVICNYKIAYEYLESIYDIIRNSNAFRNKIIECLYYEFKLYKCKNESEIKEAYTALENKIKMLNKGNYQLITKIRSVKIILSLGYKEYAKECFNKIEEYPGNYDYEGMYIFLELSFSCKNNYTFLINKALRVCSFITNQSIKSDLYFMIGKSYFELECYSICLNYYYESLVIHISIIDSLPDNDKLIYINNSNFLMVREYFFKCLNQNLKAEVKYTKFDEAINSSDINVIMDELKLQNMLKNKNVYAITQDLYKKCYYNDFDSIYKVLKHFSSDIISNLDNLLKYIVKVTLSDKAVIVKENNKGQNEVICSYRVSDKNEVNRYCSIKLDSEEDIVVISNNDSRFENLEDGILKDGIKACIYMKLRNKYSYLNTSVSVNARLILIADNAINYINSDSQKIVENLRPFMIFLLEKHNLTIDSTLDKLTNVYNRKYFEEALISLINDSRINQEAFSVIMFDIDDFKWVNDQYGHQTGDEVLIKVTRAAKKCISSNQIIGRYGGEEFIILLPKCGQKEAMDIAEKIRLNVEESKSLGNKKKVTISIGVVTNTEESLDSKQLIERADQALYKAKKSGKNRCVLWDCDYDISNNTNNEIAGILTGNLTKDYNIFSILKDVANLSKSEGEITDKFYKFIFKITQIIECDTASLLIVNNKEIVNIYSKETAKDGWYITEKFNFELIEKIIQNQKGEYLVDWETTNNYNYHGIPDWKSLCIVPIVLKGEVISIIYLSVSVNKKEFSYSDFNLLNFFAEIAAPIFC